MSTLKNPVGPQPASVYWRRRLVVGLGLLAVIIVVVLIIVRPGSGTPAPGPSNSAAAGGDTTQGSDASNVQESGGGASGLVPCDPTKVALEPMTDATDYEPGVNPELWFTMKSSMTEPCELAAGSDLQEYRITSGEEVIWSSSDCQVDPVAATTTLQPGVPKEGPRLSWDRTRSSADTCDTPGEAVTGGGASYHLSVSIGDDISSTDTRQFLIY